MKVTQKMAIKHSKYGFRPCLWYFWNLKINKIYFICIWCWIFNFYNAEKHHFQKGQNILYFSILRVFLLLMTASCTENTILCIKFTSYFHFWWNEKKQECILKTNMKENCQIIFSIFLFLFNFWSSVLIFDSQIKIC